MPKLFKAFGFIFHFYSNDHEPIHVHVDGKGTKNKYEIETQEWKKKEANPKDLKNAKKEIDKRSDEIKNKWNKFFKDK